MFKKGQPKFEGSGRKKGTPHKKSEFVREILEAHDFNLVEQILNRLSLVDQKTQINTLAQLLPYVYPKLISAEIKSSVDGFRIIVEDYSSSKTSEYSSNQSNESFSTPLSAPPLLSMAELREEENPKE